MSDAENAGDVCEVPAVDSGEGVAVLAAVPVLGGSVHVIMLRGGDGWELSHPGSCAAPGDCPVAEAAGRISRAMCATLGRWACDVQGGGLMLLERLGDA